MEPPTPAEMEAAQQLQLVLEQEEYMSTVPAVAAAATQSGVDYDEIDSQDEYDDDDIYCDDFAQFASDRMKRAAALQQRLQSLGGAPSDPATLQSLSVSSRRKWLDGMRKRDHF